MKKLLSILLAVVIMLTAAVPLFSALAVSESCNCGNTPVIYIKGRTQIYRDTENLDAGKAEKEFSGDYFELAVLVAKLAKAHIGALITDNWDEFCDAVYNLVIRLYDGYALNNDGEIGNKSGINPDWSIENILKRAYEGGKERHIAEKDNIYMYEFQYDMRLDPLENVKNLRKLVEAVKEITGHDKVNILGRCEGGVIENAYFGTYGWDDVESVVAYNSIACGTEVADACFSGEVFLDPDSINRLAYDYYGESPLIDFALTFVETAKYTGLLKYLTDSIQEVYDVIAPNIMARLMRDIFGTSPGWYSLLSEEYYEKSKSFILGDNADGKYDKLIEKIDNYHYNYQVNARETLEKMEKDGVKVYLIAKYNRQMYPVMENRSLLGDSTVSVYSQTYRGATCSDIGKTLSDEYIASADKKFLSPDKMIDASTGVLPEHTWYIRNMSHEMYPDSMNPYLLRLMRSENYADVNTYEDMPQWLIYSKQNDTFTPMTEENAPAADEGRPTDNPMDALKNVAVRFWGLIKYAFERITAR